MYKVIYRILADILKLFMADAVQGNQVGFIKGRLLCENVLLASELVFDFHVYAPTTRGCLHIDLVKEFVNMNWCFVINILKPFDLPLVFINWIKECINSASFSIALNGELVGFFLKKKELRQRDPISSHLFDLAMDILSKDLDLAAMLNHFNPHPLCLDPLVTHLNFANDVLIFFDGTKFSLAGIL